MSHFLSHFQIIFNACFSMGILTFSHTLYKIMHEIYIYCFVYYFIDITSEALWQKTDLQKQHLKN